VKEEIVDEKVSFPKSLIVKSLNKSLFKQEVEIVNNHVKEIIIADQYTQRQVEWKYHVHNTIVPYGVDCDFFSQGTPEVIEERYHLFMHFVIVQNDFFTPNRNQLELVKIVEKIHERTPSLSLLLIGNDETKYANVVKKYVDDRKIDFVTFVGDVPRELIRDIYSAADVCVFPGRGGIWLSPLEAICSGVPTIYTAELKVQQDYIKAKFTWDSFCKSVLEILKQHRRHVF
jgi:glycosyltransferase involved in cell wall biosynthesis